MPTISLLPAHARPARCTVLLVEADPPDARLKTDWLTHEGARGPIVLGATSVTEACAVIAACQVDCIVLHLGLADAWGPEALSVIMEVAPGVPVVVLTSAVRLAAGQLREEGGRPLHGQAVEVVVNGADAAELLSPAGPSGAAVDQVRHR